MLRILRVVLALLCFLALTMLFVDVTGFAVEHWSWMAMSQFIPALMALNIGVVAILLVLTVVFGRLYCSILCPLGVYQDIVARISSWFVPKKKRRVGTYKYEAAKTRWRVGFLIAFVVLMILGLFTVIGSWCAGLIDPYSAFGRMMTWIVRPGVAVVNNGLANLAEANDSYMFVHSTMPAVSIPVLVVAVVTLVIVTVFAWRSGRGYCNTVCPVGTILGCVAKFSWLKPVINTDKCISCGACGRKCKASCIDTKNHAIDYTRCVTCFDCIGSCKEGAITYAHRPNKQPELSAADGSRRAFLLGGAFVASSIAAKASDGGLAPIKQKKASQTETPVVPAGARGLKHLSAHCTACQLCISNCPNQVLRPSTELSNFMQPVMAFNNGYCRPECTVCSDICPNGAILPIDIATKSSTKIGTAVVNLETCISAAYGQQCGNCSHKCPTGAITMIPVAEGDRRLRPLVNVEACIGCGSCEYHCPVGKAGNITTEYPAIHVEGIDLHRLI